MGYPVDMTGGLFCATVASVLSWSRSSPRVPAVGRLLSRYSIMSTLLGRWWCEDLVSSAQGRSGHTHGMQGRSGRTQGTHMACRAHFACGFRSLAGVARSWASRSWASRRSWASLARASLVGSLASLVGIARILSCTCCRAFELRGLECPRPGDSQNHP